MTTTTYAVTGMTCAHCVAAVTEEIGRLPGVSHVKVELTTGGTSAVTVDSDGPLDDALVRDAVDEAGYELAASAATGTVARTVAAATAGLAVVFATMFGVGRLVPPVAPAPAVPQQAPATPADHEMTATTGHQG